MKYIWSFNWWIFSSLMVNFLNFPSDCVAYFSAAPSISQYVRFLIWQSFEWRAAPCTCSDWWKLPPPSQLLATDEIQLGLEQQQRWLLLRGKWKRPPEKWKYLLLPNSCCFVNFPVEYHYKNIWTRQFASIPAEG